MLIVRHREVTTLSVAQARTLLTSGTAEGLFGINLADLPAGDEVPLLEALHGLEGTLDDWRARLEGLCVPLLDVNMASVERLVRIPGMTVDEAQTLVNARPYLNMEELGQEGTDLAMIKQRVAPFVNHDGYYFIDKPVERLISFTVDLAEGVLVWLDPNADLEGLMMDLVAAGMHNVLVDDEGLLYLCHWQVDVPAMERPARLRLLKRSASVVSVSPVLKDYQGQVRVPYPHRLEVMLNDGADDASWDRLIATHQLITVEQYLPHYRSLMVSAHPHDLGAVYRILRTLVKDVVVRFAEPAYIVG